MPACYLDHLVITAPSLDVGANYVEHLLGVRPRPGGEHARLGTHNSLLRLGDTVYLEVIAVNPNAVDPGRPRWFDLDLISAGSRPRLATWVVRCDDIHAAAAASPIPLGPIESMSRGGLQWLITIPADGRLIYEGVIPTQIQWAREPHPASGLPDTNTALARLELRHPRADEINAVLAAIGFDGRGIVDRVAASGSPGLAAHIQTPAGIRAIPGPSLDE